MGFEKKCKRCNSNKRVEEHHVLPKFMDNREGKGELIDLCKYDCHMKLHSIMAALLWKYIPEEKKEMAKKEIDSFTKYFVDNINKKCAEQKELDEYKALDFNYDDETGEDFIEKGELNCFYCGATNDIEDKYCHFCGEVNYIEDDYGYD